MHRVDTSIHILLVEDDSIDILHMKYGLREYHVTNILDVAVTAVEALAKIYEKKETAFPTPKMIILDINLPKMNGFEFLKILQKDPKYKSIPVIIVSTSNSDSDQATAKDFNVAGYFTKPLNLEEFMPLYDKIIAA